MAPQAQDGRIGVLVVDDHRAFAEAIGMALDSQEDLRCLGVATTATEALEAAATLCPDVVLMDVHLPDLDGIEATLRLKAQRPQTRILILTADTDPGFMAQAAGAGACGFLLKTAPVSEVLKAIRTAGEGGLLVDPSALSAVLDRLRQQARPPPQRPGLKLTVREREVLEAMGEGLDVRAMSRRLGISVHTTRGHVKSILAKLGAHSQLEAVVTAIRLGLLSGPSAAT